MQRKVNVVEDLKGNKIEVIHDVIFQGKRSVGWSDVEQYLKQFVGKEYIIEENGIMYLLSRCILYGNIRRFGRANPYVLRSLFPTASQTQRGVHSSA